MKKNGRAAAAAGRNQDLAGDFRTYALVCLKIWDKSGAIVPFVPNPGQELLVSIVEDWQRAYPGPAARPTLYIIILKARQIGFSTCTEAFFFHRLDFTRNMTAMVVPYDENSTVNISEIAARFYQHLPAVRARAKAGESIVSICAWLGISRSTFYDCKESIPGLGRPSRLALPPLRRRDLFATFTCFFPERLPDLRSMFSAGKGGARRWPWLFDGVR
ncbi:MAG: hypothetical protein ACOX8W_01740 [bacterium]|jgi:hypothetical protein